MRKVQKSRGDRFVLSMLVLLVLAMIAGTAPAWSASYFEYVQWGGTWHDANKTRVDDSLMCWAASAANILDWGNWDTATYNTETKMFQKLKAHWTNNRGWQSWAWNWWLTGAKPYTKTYAYVNITGGGKYFPGTSMYSYYRSASGSGEMAVMDALMHKGYGISLVIGPGRTAAHAITAWGFDYTTVSGKKNYTGIYITDSDDGVTTLKRLGLAYNITNGWYLTSGYKNWRINGVYGFARKSGTVASGTASYIGSPSGSADVAPILPTWLLVGPALLLLCLLRLRNSYAAIRAK